MKNRGLNLLILWLLLNGNITMIVKHGFANWCAKERAWGGFIYIIIFSLYPASLLKNIWSNRKVGNRQWNKRWILSFKNNRKTDIYRYSEMISYLKMKMFFVRKILNSNIFLYTKRTANCFLSFSFSFHPIQWTEVSREVNGFQFLTHYLHLEGT